MSSLSTTPLKDSYSNFYVLPSETQVSRYVGKASFYGLFAPFGHDPGPTSNLPHTCAKQNCFMAGSAVTHA